jgi:hypothetical protein
MPSPLDRFDVLAAAIIQSIQKATESLSPVSNHLANQLESWNTLVSDLRSDIAHQARELGVAIPTWEDRDGFFRNWQQLEHLRSIAPCRKRWNLLGRQLQAGRFTHRLQRKQQELEALRSLASDEAIANSAGDAPELTGPADESDWLAWAWASEAGFLEQLVDDLAAKSPNLARILSDAHVSWWQPGSPAGEGPPSVTSPMLSSLVPGVVGDTPPAAGELPGMSGTIPCPLTGETALGTPLLPGGTTEAGKLATPNPASPLGAEVGQAEVGQPRVPVAQEPMAPLVEEVTLISADLGNGPLAPEAVQPPEESDIGDPYQENSAQAADQEAALQLPTAVQQTVNLPQMLQSFETFQEEFWVDPESGRCEPTPWSREDFCDKLRNALTQSLFGATTDFAGHLGRAWVFAKALQEVGIPAPQPASLSDLAKIWREPTKLGQGRDAGRVAAIRRAVEGLAEASDLRLLLVLEAMRPTREDMLYGEEVTRALEKAQFHPGPLPDFVSELLRFHTQSEADPFARLRAELNKAPAPVVNYAELLKKRRDELHNEIKRIRLNAGRAYVGRFEHCSRAWDVFMERILPPLREVFPEGPSEWDPVAKAAWVNQIIPTWEKIADRHNVREKSRKTMDRVVKNLVDGLREINDAMRQVGDVRARRGEVHVTDLVRGADNLLHCRPLLQPDEELARCVLLRALEPPGADAKASPDPMMVGTELLTTQPELLRLLPPPVAPSRPEEGVSFEQMEPGRLAAALLLGTPAATLGAAPPTWEGVADRLRELRRYDLLGVLFEELAGPDRQASVRAAHQVLVDLRNRSGAARRIWRDLEDLAVPWHRHVLEVIQAADLCIDGVGNQLAGNAQLLAAWLGKLCDELARMRDEAIRGWEASIRAEGGRDAEARLRALSEKRWADATRLDAGRLGEPRAWRETTWRAAASRQFPNSREQLLQLAERPDVVQAWCADYSDPAQRHNRLASLRAHFVKWVFDDRSGSLYKGRDRESRQHFALEISRLRDYLAGHQPTFLPQLHEIRTLILTTPTRRPTDPDFVQNTIDLASQLGPNVMTVLLCPGMKPAVRTQIQEALHDRSLFAAALDDLDLCRLLNPGGKRPNRVLGLLELALEQQPWRERSPFALSEGADVRMEMYVGRRNEARQLATTGHYTRLFSGRKLGKTALLQFVRQTWNRRQLPNGKILRVIYVGIAGVREERTFVKKVLTELRGEFPEANLQLREHSGEDFLSALRAFLRKERGINLLIVLDEADEFVLAQLEEYVKRKEACLTFKLRSERFGAEDEPRARFVFTGYRATATYEGAWANWGEVLKLVPLALDEGAGLVGRPLARMGIDATDQADGIAFRCGYQPAVLLKFGSRLLNRLADGGYRENVTVTAEDVIETFQESDVQEEIRRVVQANFQGNPLGKAVFAVLLDLLSRLPLGQGLWSAEGRILSSFSENCPGARGWLPEEDIASTALITNQLKDMVDRGLLVKVPSPGDAPAYRLKFHHHLASLLVDLHLPTEIRTNLEAWRQTRPEVGAGEVGDARGPLHRSDMLLLHELWRGELGDLTPAVIAVGTLWEGALEAETGGLADRLGLDQLKVGDAGELLRPTGVPGRHLWMGASPEAMGRALTVAAEGERLVFLTGGIDLLRDALGRARVDPGQAEAFGPYRLTDGSVRWWFQRVRGVEFPTEQDYNEVYRRTAGIPFLVGAFDRLLLPNGPPPGGFNPSALHVQQVYRHFQEHLQADRFGLIDGPPSRRLLERERDLVRMVHVISAEFAGDEKLVFSEWLREEWTPEMFGSQWETLYGKRAFPIRYLDEPGDAVGLEVLLLLGLLPARKGGEPATRVAPLPTTDPICLVWQRLE